MNARSFTLIFSLPAISNPPHKQTSFDKLPIITLIFQVQIGKPVDPQADGK
jgi:hypothetical protein